MAEEEVTYFDYKGQIEYIWNARKNKTINDDFLTHLVTNFNSNTFAICMPFNKNGELKKKDEVNNEENIQAMNNFIEEGTNNTIADKKTVILFLLLCGNNYFLSPAIFEKGILKEKSSGGGKRNLHQIQRKHTRRIVNDIFQKTSVKHKKEGKLSTKIKSNASTHLKSTLKK